MTSKRVYGPVPSRRFGLSLGVDLVPHKTCCLDCTYCQLGPTTRLTTVREEFFPLDRVLDDVRAARAHGPTPDVVTLAGSGEPALYRPLDELIDGLHGLGDAPVLFLTNGALLFEPEVAAAARRADILAPSLDAGDPETFRVLNRPEPSIDFERMLQGLERACRDHPGTVRLEVMLVRGVNDTPRALEALAGRIAGLRADSVDINTPVRPVPARGVEPCQAGTLERAREMFGPYARIVASTYRGPPAPEELEQDSGAAVLDMLARRPCTLDDIHVALGIHRNQIVKVLDQARSDGIIEERAADGQTYFFVPES